MRKYGVWAEIPEKIPEDKITERMSADIVICGAGIAGVTCAMRAAQCGSSVIVLEKTSSWSARGGNIGVVNSTFMKSQGYENDADTIRREWIKRGANRCNEKLLKRYFETSPEAMDWLLDIVTKPEYGCIPILQGSFYKGETYRENMGSHRLFDGPMAKKGARAGSPDAVFAMYSESVKLGATYLFSSPAVELTESGGKVTGVIAEHGGSYIEITAKRGVVLATGDIGGNADMCEDLAPLANRCKAKIYTPKDANTGDGHRLGFWAGGEFEDAPFATMLHPQAYHFRNYCFLFVKPDGTRFMNEDNYVQGKTVAILRENIDCAWSIIDDDWRNKVPQTLPYGGGLFWGCDCKAGENEFIPEEEERMFALGVKRGVIVSADTPQELAEKMGVPQNVFTEEFTRYNEMCRNKKDTDFGKRQELLIPLDKPPYHAMKFGPALLAVVGGLKVNEHMQVLSSSGPINGLYAVGNTMGGRYGVDYPVIIPGNSHGTALTFSYILGKELSE